MIDLSKIQGLKKEQPASTDEIRNVQDKLGAIIPEAYKKLLLYTNGFSTKSGILIYGTDAIMERNLTLEVEEYAKGYIAIGDDGGDTVFLMLQKTNAKGVLSVDSGDMNPLNSKVISSDLIEWLHDGFSISSLSINNVMRPCDGLYDIVLLDFPQGGLKDLAKIKAVLGIKMTSVELLKASKNLPFNIIRNITYGKALNYLEKLKDFDKILKLQSSNKQYE